MTTDGCAATKRSLFFRWLVMPLLLFLWPGMLLANDLLFVPRVSLSIAQYEFTKPPTIGGLPGNGTFPRVKFDTTFKVLGAGGTLFKNSYYFDLFYQKSLQESESFTVENIGLPNNASFTVSIDDVRRRDYSLTFGKKIFDGRAGVYAGYKSGKTGGPQPQGEHMSFEEKGFFVGGNYGWLISDLGVLSVNLAYAKLDGNRTQKTNTGFEPDFIVDFNGNGDAEGLSYGTTWTSRFTDHVSYSAALEVRQYTFDNIKDVNPQVTFTDEIEEKFSGITFSVYYTF